MLTRQLFPALAALALVASPALAKKNTPPDKKPPAAASSGSLNALTLTCSPPNADVYVDNEMIGKAPIELPVPVSNGSHAIRVVRLGFSPYIDVFKAVPGKPVKLQVELIPVTGVLHIKSSQSQVRVLVDGKYVGDAPVDVEMDAGKRVVQVTKAGFYEWKRDVKSVAGQDVEFEVALKELPADINPYVVKPVTPPKWYQKKWVWGIVAGAAVLVAGGVTTGAVLASRDPLAGADTTFKVNGLSSVPQGVSIGF